MMHFDDDKDMLEVGPDALGSKGKCSRLLEDNGHDVVSYVPFPQELQSRSEQTLTELQTRFSAETKCTSAVFPRK